MKWVLLVLTLVLVLAMGAFVHRQLARSQRAAAPTTTAAGRGDALTGGSGGGLRAQAPAGDHGDDADWPRLKFTIKNVRRDRKVTAQPPYHEDGGTWTVFDCHVIGGGGGGGAPSPAVFTVAVDTPARVKDAGDVPIAFGNMMVLPPGGANGQNLVVALARAFQHDPPAPRATKTPLVPARFRTAHLGDGMQAHPDGGYGGSGGNWSATKWFCNAAGYEAEVFFNYNLVDGVGEFAEKDSDYRDDLLNVLALVMRDGPRPPRTPENDPNLATAGPRVEDLRPIPNSNDAQFLFSPGGKRLVVHKFEPGKSVAFMIDPAKPAEQTQVAQLEGWMSDVICFDADVTRVAVEEQMVKDLKSFSGDAARRIWIIVRATGQRKRVEGPWGDAGSLFADQSPLAPDGRYLVIHSLTPTAKPGASAPGEAALGTENARPRPRRQAMWHFYNVASGASVQAKLPVAPDEDVEMIGWTGGGGGGGGASLRAVMKTGDRFDDDERPRQTLLVDPTTGTTAHSSVQPASFDPFLSPDGRLRMSLTPRKRLDVLDTSGGRLRTFTFHEDDRRFAEDGSAFEWLSARYIRFDAQRPGFIDVRTMKLSYLPRTGGTAATQGSEDGGGEDDGPYFRYSPDFRWAVTRGGGGGGGGDGGGAGDSGLLIGRVVLPLE